MPTFVFTHNGTLYTLKWLLCANCAPWFYPTDTSEEQLVDRSFISHWETKPWRKFLISQWRKIHNLIIDDSQLNNEACRHLEFFLYFIILIISFLDVQVTLLFHIISLITEHSWWESSGFLLLLGEAAYTQSSCFVSLSSEKLHRLGRHSG